ncbi:MAG: SRPBCC family protein [Waddliaceae bacterium]
MFHWTVSEAVHTKASTDEIWSMWQDVHTWPKWDKELDWCEISGPFASGAKGRLKPKGWFAAQFVITKVAEGKSFEDETHMPFTRVVFDHRIQELGNENLIIHSVTTSGLLAPLLWLFLGRKLKKGLRTSIETLAHLAEQGIG